MPELFSCTAPEVRPQVLASVDLAEFAHALSYMPQIWFRPSDQARVLRLGEKFDFPSSDPSRWHSEEPLVDVTTPDGFLNGKQVIYRATRGEGMRREPRLSPPLTNSHNRKQHSQPVESQRATVELYEGAAAFEMRRNLPRLAPALAERGAITGFSRKSRNRMIQMCNRIAYDPENLPLFVGLTFPDEYFQQHEPEDVLGRLTQFTKALRRRFPAVAAIWKKELQDRKSGVMKGDLVPHYHCLFFGHEHKIDYVCQRGKWVDVRPLPDGQWRIRIWALDEAGKRFLYQDETVRAGQKDRFKEWLERTWYECVGSGQVKHFHQGSHVDLLQKIRGVQAYISKYVAKVQDHDSSPYSIGRWWGIVGSENIPWAKRRLVELTDKEVCKVMRTYRRYTQSRAKPGFKVRFGSNTVHGMVEDNAQWSRYLEFVIADRNTPF
jgi:hypothetical protein